MSNKKQHTMAIVSMCVEKWGTCNRDNLREMRNTVAKGIDKETLERFTELYECGASGNNSKHEGVGGPCGWRGILADAIGSGGYEVHLQA